MVDEKQSSFLQQAREAVRSSKETARFEGRGRLLGDPNHQVVVIFDDHGVEDSTLVFGVQANSFGVIEMLYLAAGLELLAMIPVLLLRRTRSSERSTQENSFKDESRQLRGLKTGLRIAARSNAFDISPIWLHLVLSLPLWWSFSGRHL